jgi:hypothetical protein
VSRTVTLFADTTLSALRDPRIAASALVIGDRVTGYDYNSKRPSPVEVLRIDEGPEAPAVRYSIQKIGDVIVSQRTHLLTLIGDRNPDQGPFSVFLGPCAVNPRQIVLRNVLSVTDLGPQPTLVLTLAPGADYLLMGGGLLVCAA